MSNNTGGGVVTFWNSADQCRLFALFSGSSVWQPTLHHTGELKDAYWPNDLSILSQEPLLTTHVSGLLQASEVVGGNRPAQYLLRLPVETKCFQIAKNRLRSYLVDLLS
jgi:hypothetical protein